jgi:alkanesulfonate monooxygenase SsuD/methylene tetrahydromethanopterin reductase-like flavin-dependent oxidoreductase (luciferase family)
MKLGIFMMPVHPLHRSHTETLKEDRETVILADRLGFHDAFIGEHLTDQAENITNSLLFLATLIHSTKTIKLASGTCNLSQIHPAVVAANAAMFDHLAEGRFILGVSPGALVSDAEALGIIDEDRNKMFAEAIDVILAIWEREPPYDIEFPGNRFKVTTRRTMHLETGVGIMPRPYQKPRPEIVGTVVRRPGRGDRASDFTRVGQLCRCTGQDARANYAEGRRKRRKPDRRMARRAHAVRRRRRQGRRGLRPPRRE